MAAELPAAMPCWGLTPLLPRSRTYPRLRYMGSKFRVLPHLATLFAQLEFDTALDAFSGSGVVSYCLKEMGKQVTSNDFLNFSATVARAVVENPGIGLSDADLAEILSPATDGRSFIHNTFQGLYFPDEDHAFLDAAWSHLETFSDYKHDVAVAALCLAAARKQPRGVFTVTGNRYDDGRRSLHTPLRKLFVEAVADYNACLFDNGRQNRALCKDVFDLDPEGYDLVYLDPPYVSPSGDDNCYIKRYHFVEGLSVYWRDLQIMASTTTKKLPKRATPFASKQTIRQALREMFHQFRRSAIVLSYSTNSIPSATEIYAMLLNEKSRVDLYEIPLTYSFGNHAAAKRRRASELIFVAR